MAEDKETEGSERRRKLMAKLWKMKTDVSNDQGQEIVSITTELTA